MLHIFHGLTIGARRVSWVWEAVDIVNNAPAPRKCRSNPPATITPRHRDTAPGLLLLPARLIYGQSSMVERYIYTVHHSHSYAIVH